MSNVNRLLAAGFDGAFTWLDQRPRVLTHGHYAQPSDGFRAKVAGLQHTAATTLRELYQELDVSSRVDRRAGRRRVPYSRAGVELYRRGEPSASQVGHTPPRQRWAANRSRMP